MNDSDDETPYPSRPNAAIYSSSLRSRRSIRNPSSYPRNNHYGYNNEFQYNHHDDDEESDDEEDNQEFSSGENEYGTFQGKKKRKLETLVSNYKFAPRPGSKEMWSEEESFVLLEVWGERYLELGRRSLRAEDWGEVAEKVTEMIGVEKSEVECRNQLDVLKKKYKKEITKMEKNGGGFHSKWAFFKKMDMLMNLRMKGHCGLGCGLDSGEYVFMDPRMYLDRSNVLDEMRDSPAGSDADDDEEEEQGSGGWQGDDESAKLLADSIQRFGQIYEKIENSKRKQMMELEKMRRDFQRELEVQKKQIVERAQVEIAKIRDNGENDDDEDNEDEDGEETDDISGEKLRG
ncbi:trihelix transcription factor ENAP1 [Solanum dulcamara]|uniref:trihelix transcription factor ENAP1 n=1 Tax=Solanum dulcamara TaxID=45834 RepID=UPI0024861180|nr:trihelix transcription factor ENAP1 [Solanum dulcamara]